MQETVVQMTWESLIPALPVYTIGYGGRSIEQFIELLNRYEIEFLIDVRSQPYSRFHQRHMCSTEVSYKRREACSSPFYGGGKSTPPNASSPAYRWAC